MQGGRGAADVVKPHGATRSFAIVLASAFLGLAAAVAAALSPAGAQEPARDADPAESARIESDLCAGQSSSEIHADSLASYAALLLAASVPGPDVETRAGRILEESRANRRRAERPEGAPAAPAWTTPTLADAEALYDYVARHVATVDRHLEAPRTAGEVLRAGEGDSGEKHTLLTALLAAGVPELEARPAFVGERTLTVLSLGSSEVWLDPSSGVAPFGYLEPDLRGRETTLGGRDGCLRTVRTPELPVYADVYTVELSGDLAPDGSLSGGVLVRARGDTEFKLRRAFRQVGVEAWGDLVAALAEIQGFHGTVEARQVTEPTSVSGPFAFAYSVDGRGYLFGGEPDAFLSLPAADLPFPVVQAGEPGAGRPPPFEAVRRVELEVPPDMVARPPRDIALAGDFATYRASYRLEEGRLEVLQRLSVRVRHLGEDRMAEWEAFRDAVREDLRQVVAVERRGSRPRGDRGKRARAEERERAHALEALRARADSALERGDARAAIPDLERFLEAVPRAATARARLAFAYLEVGRTEEAAALLEALAAERPFHDHVHRNLGVALERLDRLEEAAAAYRLHLGLEPFDVAALAHLGRLLARSGHHADAVPVLRLAADVDPNGPWIPLALADALDALGRKPEALEALEEGLRRDPRDARAGERRAWLLGELERWKEAVAAYRDVEAPDPRSRSFHAGYAYALMRAEGRESAESELRRTAEVRRSDPVAHAALAWLLASTGRPSAALPPARAAATLDPDRAAYWALVGRLEHHVNGDAAAALEAFERARELDPSILDAEPEDRALYQRLRGVRSP